MPSWKKVIVSGSDASLNSLNVTSGVTGSLQGTASYANNANLLDGKDSTIFATTGSNIFIGTQTVTGSLFTTGSNTLIGNTSLTGSLKISGSQTVTGYIQFEPVVTNVDNNISASYIYVSGSTNDLYFTQNGQGYSNTTRLRWLEGNLYTGLLSGGVLSTTIGSTTFNLSSGSAVIVNLNASTGSTDPYPTVQYVKWSNYTNVPITYSGSAAITYVGVDNAGAIVQQTVPWGTTDITQWDTQIEIGVVLHLTGSVSTGVYNSPQLGYGFSQRTDDFVRAFGPLKITGHTLQPSGSTLGLIKTGGQSYNNGSNYTINPNHPSTVTDPAITTSKIYRYYVSGSTPIIDTGVAAAGYTFIDPTKYNNNGTLASVPGGSYTIQRVFWIPNSPTNAFLVYYGNATYNSAAAAQAAIDTEPFTEAPNTAQNAILVAYIIVAGNETNLQNATFVPGGLFRSIAGVGNSNTAPVSNTLAGLSDVSVGSRVAGDLLYYNGSQWINSKSLSGSYSLTGSLTTNDGITAVTINATSFTGSLLGTASYATYAVSASNVLGGLNNYMPVWSGSNTLVTSSIVQKTNSNVLNTNIGQDINKDYNSLTLYAFTEPALYLSSSNGDYLGLYNSFGQVALAYFGTVGTNNLVRYNGYTDKSLTFQTNFTDRLTINASGSVRFNVYTTNGLLKTTGSNGSIVMATASVDYVIPSTLNNYVLNSQTSSMSVATASFATSSVSSSYPFAVTGSTIYSYNTVIVPHSSFGIQDGSIVIGDKAGTGNTRGTDSVFIGTNAGSGSQWEENVFIGLNAGVRNSGSIGVAIGPEAGYNGASSTVAIGYSAGYNTTVDSYDCVFIGGNSGREASNTAYVNFIGIGAGTSAKNIFNSNFIGYYAGENATSASYSTFVGYYAGRASAPSSSIGKNNIVLGNFITLPSQYANGINIGGLIFGSGSYDGESNSYQVISGSANGKIGINQPSPQYNLDVSGSGRYTNGLIVSSGSVGIGTTSPSSLLHVYGSSASPLIVERSSTSSNIGIRYKNASTSWYSGLASNDNFAISFNDANLAAGLFHINTNGNVGIGTTTPSTKLEVYNATDDRHFLAVGSAPSLNLGNTNSAPLYYGTLGMATATNNFIQGSAAGDLALVNRGSISGSILFGIGSSTGNEKMRITPAGNVGIGTTSPTAKLHIQNLAATTNSNILTIDAEHSNSTVSLFEYNHYGPSGGSGFLRFNRANGTVSSPTIASANQVSGRVGSRLYDGAQYTDNALIRFSADGTPALNDTPGRIEFFTTPAGTNSLTEKMRITSAGNVGIGTSNPSLATLQVQGNVSASSYTGSFFGTASFAVSASWAPGGAASLSGGATNYVARWSSSTTLTTGSLYDTGGSVGIGTSSPTSPLHVLGSSNTVYFQGSGSNILNVSGSTGLVLSVNDNNVLAGAYNSTSSLSMLTITGSIVAIGANQPNFYWYVSESVVTDPGALIIRDASTSGTGNPSLILQRGLATANGDWKIQNSGGNFIISDGWDSTKNYNWRTTSSFSISAGSGDTPGAATFGGSVGIGTTSPSFKLQVDHSTTSQYVASFRNTGDNLQLKVGTTTGGLLNIQGSTIDADSAYNIALQADGGNVGIGTSNPSTAKLVISTTSGAEGIDLSTADSYANLRVIRNSLSSIDKDMYIGYQSGATSTLHLYSDNSETITVKGQRVGISSTSPSYKLDVRTGNDDALRIINSAGSNNNGVALAVGSGTPWIDFWGSQLDIKYNTSPGSWNGGANRFITILSGGNVGIGTTTPAATLDINGDLELKNAYYNAYSSSVSGTTTLATIPTSSFNAVFFDFVAFSGSNQRAGTLIGNWRSGTVQYTEYSTPDIGSTSAAVTMSIALSGANALVQSVSAPGWAIKATYRTV